MGTYTTLTGPVVDVARLPGDARAYLERALAAYRAGPAWAAFTGEFVYGAGNPFLRDGMITEETWANPAFRCVRDLGARLGIAQGCIAPEGEPARDPLADDWISVAEAAARAGVTVQGLHGAIRRGAVVARPEKPNGSWLLVSVNSLGRWTPNRVRQAARRRSSGTAPGPRAASGSRGSARAGRRSRRGAAVPRSAGDLQAPGRIARPRAPDSARGRARRGAFTASVWGGRGHRVGAGAG